MLNADKTKEEFIIKLLEIVDDDRSDDWEKWRNISFIVHNELKNDGFDIFDKFSQRSSKYNKNKIKKFWESIKDDKENPLTLKSLVNLAKKDNQDEPKLYREIIKEFLIKDTKIKENKEDNESVNKTLENYNKVKIVFEKNNFKVVNPLMYITIGEKEEIIKRNRKDFKDVYENLVYLKWNEWHNKFIMSSFIDDWLTDPDMRTYYKLDFLPMQRTPENVYNTFTGYEVDKKELIKTDIENSLIIKHIKNLCNNSDDVFNYVINFFARKVQQPYNLTNTALIFKSNEGAGKDIFFNWFGNKILGSEYYYNTEKPELLYGKFTSSLENKILIVVNETSGKDTFQINENIKCAITAETNIIEHKGLKPYKNTNHIGYIYLTNNDNPLKVPADDRRFCGIECNNLICNNKEYFIALKKEMDSGEYNKAFFNYLMSIECGHYDFTNERPKTNFYNDLQELNKPPLINFIENFILEHKEKDNIIEIASSLLYTKFNDYVTKFNFKCVISLTKFIMDIKKIEGTDQKKTRTTRNIIFIVDTVKKFLKTKYNIEFVDDNDEDFDDDNDDDNEKKNPLDNIL